MAIKKVLIFGGLGAIGREISDIFKSNNWVSIVVSRDVASDKGIQWNPCNPIVSIETLGRLKSEGPFDAVVWSQGMNLNDSIYEFKMDSHMEMYQVNVVYILNSLKQLLTNDLLAQASKLCIVSSIWQNISRQNKLSYSVTKSALQGLVLSACNDLGRDGHLINAVLPGALDTPMTRANLEEGQIKAIESSTQFNNLAKLTDVANTVFFLCSDSNTGVTGNFVTVDQGFSHVRNI